MEGLVDYVKRQVKCPECRAEHRIPYNGIQGFPTNYTLTKFLELHAEITGTVFLTYLLTQGTSMYYIFWDDITIFWDKDEVNKLLIGPKQVFFSLSENT